jgi:N-methylhydantoinase A/oxoprolinase/acetone carboxylase beta subunit
MESPVRVDVDIGGTFTDLVLVREDGSLLVAKTPSSPADPGAASNAILQRRGAPTGLLTTRGFRDVLEIGRMTAPVQTPVIGWDQVGAAGVAGPRIVESYDSTVVVPPGATVSRDTHANLAIALDP